MENLKGDDDMKKTIVMVLIMSLLFITGCSGGSGTESVETSDGTTETVTDNGVETATQSFDEEKIKSQLEITELGMYVQPFSNTTCYGYAVEVKNNSDQDIVLSCQVNFYGSDGSPVGSEDSMNSYVNAGVTTLLYADGRMEKPDKAEMEIFVKEPTHAVLSNQMTTESTLRSDKVIVEMTNNSDMDSEFACAHVAFYKGDELIDCEDCYCINDDNILEAGNTRMGDVGWIGDAAVDTVKVYPNAESKDRID